MRRYEAYSCHLPPSLIKRLRGMARVYRVPAAQILRDVLPEALSQWERERVSRPTLREEEAVEARYGGTNWLEPQDAD